MTFFHGIAQNVKKKSCSSSLQTFSAFLLFYRFFCTVYNHDKVKNVCMPAFTVVDFLNDVIER